jgi:hypothetical protein
MAEMHGGDCWRAWRRLLAGMEEIAGGHGGEDRRLMRYGGSLGGAIPRACEPHGRAPMGRSQIWGPSPLSRSSPDPLAPHH